MPSVADWLDAYLSPDTALGSWAAHLQSYWSVRDRPNVLFLTYEQMRADLPGTVDKIAKLMGVELTAPERAAVIEQAKFEHMKKIEDKFDPRGAPWASTRGAMIRRGERGKSGELLSLADQERIDDYWRAELRKVGSDFPYDEAFAKAARVAVE
jgi:aryl sulfotransferase